MNMDLDQWDQDEDQEIKMLNERCIVNILANRNAEVVTANELHKYFITSSAEQNRLVRQEIKRILANCVSSGCMLKHGRKYALSSLQNNYQTDADDDKCEKKAAKRARRSESADSDVVLLSPGHDVVVVLGSDEEDDKKCGYREERKHSKDHYMGKRAKTTGESCGSSGSSVSESTSAPSALRTAIEIALPRPRPAPPVLARTAPAVAERLKTRRVTTFYISSTRTYPTVPSSGPCTSSAAIGITLPRAAPTPPPPPPPPVAPAIPRSKTKGKTTKKPKKR